MAAAKYFVSWIEFWQATGSLSEKESDPMGRQQAQAQDKAGKWIILLGLVHRHRLPVAKGPALRREKGTRSQ